MIAKHLLPLLEGLAKDTAVYADKGYDSMENRQHLKERQLRDGIMYKSHRNRPLTEAQTKHNRHLSKNRYAVEQSFGTLHRKFRHARAVYRCDALLCRECKQRISIQTKSRSLWKVR